MNREEKINWYKNEFEEIRENIKNKNELSYYDFLRIRNFKLQNSSTAKEEKIKLITRKAFDLAKQDKIIPAIQKLIELEGIAIPIASTILAMKFPEKYAIIDRKVISALKKDEWLKEYTQKPEIYEKYLILIREHAKKRKMKLRDYERMLFEGND